MRLMAVPAGVPGEGQTVPDGMDVPFIVPMLIRQPEVVVVVVVFTTATIFQTFVVCMVELEQL